jgi:hypothetical protein
MEAAATSEISSDKKETEGRRIHRNRQSQIINSQSKESFPAERLPERRTEIYTQCLEPRMEKKPKGNNRHSRTGSQAPTPPVPERGPDDVPFSATGT